VATPAPPERETVGGDLASRSATPALATGANAAGAAKDKSTRSSSRRDARAQKQSKRSAAAQRRALEREARTEASDSEPAMTTIAPEPSVTETRRVPLVRDRGRGESDGSRVRLVH
jgi:hypothetical protein